MRKTLIPLLFMSTTAFAQPSTDGGINHSDATIEKIDKSMAAVSSIEQTILQEFNKTSLRARIVKIRVKRGKKKTKVYLTWHPQKAEDLAKDTFIIVGVINKVIPHFDFISLKAIHPKYMRWSGRVFWDATISRSAVLHNRFVEHQPHPLYRLPEASPY